MLLIFLLYMYDNLSLVYLAYTIFSPCHIYGLLFHGVLSCLVCLIFMCFLLTFSELSVLFFLLNINSFRYITYSKEEEAIRCIQNVHGFILDGRPLK